MLKTHIRTLHFGQKLTNYKKYYRTWEFDDIFSKTPIVDDDIILNVDVKRINIFTDPYFLQINDIIHQGSYEPGTYEFGTGTLVINRVRNIIADNIVVKNPPIDDINFVIL